MMRLLAIARGGLALAILFALLAVPWFAAVEPLRARIADQDARIEQTRALIVRYRQIAAAGLPSGTDGAETGAAGLLLEGASAELIAADLPRRLGEMLARSAGRPRSVQVLPAESREGLVRVGLRIDMQTGMAGLSALFHALETAEPLLFVDALAIAGPRLLRQAPGAVDAPAALPFAAGETLQVSFEVYGFAWEPGT